MSTHQDAAPARGVDAFLAGLDDVLATATAVEQDSAAPAQDTETQHDATTGHQDTTVVEDRTRQDTRDTETGQDATPRVVRVTGRSGRLPYWWDGPRALDALDDTSDREQRDTTPDTTVRDSETPAQDTATEPDETDTQTPEPDEAEQQDTPTGRRSVGKLVTGTFTKTRKAAVATADEIAARYQDDHDQVAAERERVAAAIDTLTDALQPVDPDRAWLPDWVGSVGAILIFNVSAAAAGHYTMGMLGYPDLSPAVVVYDIAENFTVGYHWSTSLIFGAMPPLTCWFLFDRRARSWSSTILRWLVRIPLASTAAGTLAATWHTIIHLATGATS